MLLWCGVERLRIGDDAGVDLKTNEVNWRWRANQDWGKVFTSATSNNILNVNGWIFMLMIIGETLRSVSELNARVKRTKIDKRINRHGRKGGSRNGLIWLESCWWKAKHVTHVTHKWAKTTNLFPALQYQRITEWQYFCLIYKWRKAELLLKVNVNKYF